MLSSIAYFLLSFQLRNGRFLRRRRLRVRRFAAGDWALSQRFLHVSVRDDVPVAVRRHHLHVRSYRRRSQQARLLRTGTIIGHLPHGEEQTQGTNKLSSPAFYKTIIRPIQNRGYIKLSLLTVVNVDSLL